MMLAMQMSPPIRYDPVLFVASVLIAIGASLAALWIAFTLRRDRSRLAIARKLASALVMGVAISGMHYTGMAAAGFPAGSVCLAAGSGLGLAQTTPALAGLAPVFRIAGHEMRVSCSIGVSVYPVDGEDLETLMRNADAAMYEAKRAGRNTVRFCLQQMRGAPADSRP